MLGGRLNSKQKQCYNPPLMTNDPTLFKGVYRIASSRLKDWDYSSPGYYFVTVCTQKKRRLFGHIVEIDEEPGAAIRLSRIGSIVEECWQGLPKQYPHISLDEYQFMPHHFHGLLFIEEQKKGITLGVIINQFKGACTRAIRERGFENFSWQPRFHDHIVRNEKDLERIRRYICENPAAWLVEEDEKQ